MAEKRYQDRDVLDKLGIKPGQSIAFEYTGQAIDPLLHQRILERAGRQAATDKENVDVVLATLDEQGDCIALLTKWRARLVPNGGIWLLTAKRGQPGYLDQRELIASGQQAGVVDNKVCSISATTSAMRFVIRKQKRSS
jgi:Protein of unknown function (DUF3052)